MLVVDAHAHAWKREWLPEQWWQTMARRLVGTLRSRGVHVSAEEAARDYLPDYWDATGTRTLEAMDEAGVDHAIILPLDWGRALGEAAASVEEINACYASLAVEHPGRIGTFYGIDPLRPEALAMVQKAFQDPAFRGLKLYPPTGFYPNSPLMAPFYELAQERGLPVLFHTGAVRDSSLRSKYAAPLHLDDVCKDFPALKVAASHFAFEWWPELLDVARTNPNLVTCFSGWQIWAGTDWERFCRVLRRFLDQITPWRVFFATDGPAYRALLPDGDWVARIAGLGDKAPSGIRFSREEIELVMGRAAAAFYQLENG